MFARPFIGPDYICAMRPARLVLASLLAVGLVQALATPGWAATAIPTAPTAPASAAAAATAASAPKVTFGLGPASATKLDGRPYFTFESSPGGVAEDHVAIENLSAQPLPLNIYATDAENAPNGALSYAARSAKVVDAGAWIAIGTPGGASTITVPAQSKIILPIELKVPDNASPGDHAAAIIVSLTSAVKNKKGELVNFEQRVADRVFIRVSGPIHAALAVQGLRATYHGTLNPIGQGSVTVTYTVKNTGNIDLGGKQKLQLSGLLGSSGKAPVLADVPLLLPGGSASLSIKIGRVWPELLMHAKVSVTPTVLAGTVNPAVALASASASFWAIPWTLLAIIVIILAVIGYLIWRLKHPKPKSGRHGNPGKPGKAKPAPVLVP
ncbi:MAG TPA: DUF916 domain-containing protein [Jatrophihabitantaceae bacterium]|nr:DUF916 domain-containing protein [Jatrophihabitantaceae bacterium]